MDSNEKIVKLLEEIRDGQIAALENQKKIMATHAAEVRKRKFLFPILFLIIFILLWLTKN